MQISIHRMICQCTDYCHVTINIFFGNYFFNATVTLSSASEMDMN